MGNGMFMFGVIRPGWDDVEEREDAFSEDGHCFYDTFTGAQWPDERMWEGT